MPPTKEREVQLGLRAPISMKREIEELAAKEDLTFSQVVRLAIRDYLARRKQAA